MPPYEYPLLLKSLLNHGVAWAPDQEIVYRDLVRHTYVTTYQRVQRLAGALLALGIKKGSRVGIMEWDSHRYLEAYFAIPGIGGVIHMINPRLAPEDIVYTIQEADDEVLLYHEDFAPLVERVRARVPTIRKYVMMTDRLEPPVLKAGDLEYEAMLAAAAPLAEFPDMDENTVASQFYTTGTTGRPKGVYFTHRQLVLHTLAGGMTIAALGNHGALTKHDVYMPLTPMFHVHAWGVPFVMTLLGVKQVYPGKYEPEMLMKLLVKEKVTFSHCVPTILQMIVAAPAAHQVDLSRWKVVIGGARLPKGLGIAASKLGIGVWSGYGMSETCPILTLSNMKPFMESWDKEKQLDVEVSTGFPIPFCDLRVVDAAGKDVARDGKETGEIIVRTPWLTPGYYKDPEKSEQLWEGGWLHTGDVANVNEYGYIQIVDRLKDIIKSGGEWIVSLELENLLSLHEGVMEAAVIGVPDERWGERPKAIVVCRDTHKGKLAGEDLKAHLTRYVSEGVITNWCVPDSYVFVDEIPKTSVGKIDKKLLRTKFS
jgi:fatty-acyl-CoA synthase